LSKNRTIHILNHKNKKYIFELHLHSFSFFFKKKKKKAKKKKKKKKSSQIGTSIPDHNIGIF